MTELADLGVPPDLLVGVGHTAQSDAAAAERRPLRLLLFLPHPLDVVPVRGSHVHVCQSRQNGCADKKQFTHATFLMVVVVVVVFWENV